MEKWQLVNEMITQQIVYYIILISKKYYKLVVIDLSKQLAPDVDPKAIRQIHFTGNLDQTGGATKFFIIEEAKKVSDFSQGTVRIL